MFLCVCVCVCVDTDAYIQWNNSSYDVDKYNMCTGSFGVELFPSFIPISPSRVFINTITVHMCNMTFTSRFAYHLIAYVLFYFTYRYANVWVHTFAQVCLRPVRSLFCPAMFVCMVCTSVCLYMCTCMACTECKGMYECEVSSLWPLWINSFDPCSLIKPLLLGVMYIYF